jgi:carboxymethylenebutenolidase
MRTETLELTTRDGPMDLYVARPDADAANAVIVIQEAFGVNDHIMDVTRRLADAGHLAVAPTMFHRAGGGTAPYGQFDKVMPLFEGVSDDGILMDVDATLSHLRGEGYNADRIGIVGFCFGGRVTFLVAARRQLGAAVGFYGGGIVTGRLWPPLVDEAKDLRTPWLGLFGDLDQSIPVEDVERLRRELASAPVDHDVVRYADAQHGFNCDVRDEYHPEAAADAWQRTLAWFGKHLTA